MGLMFISLLLVLSCLSQAAGGPGSAITVSHRLQGDEAWIRSEKLEVLRLSSDPSGDDGALTLTWMLDRGTWFPTWNLLLSSDTGLLPASGIKVGPATPVAGVDYQIELSYDNGSGTLALSVVNLDEGRVLQVHLWQVQPSDAPLRVMGPVDFVVQAYRPIAAAWDLVVVSEVGSLIPMRLIKRSDEVLVRATLGAVEEGQLKLVAMSGEQRVEIPLGEAAYEQVVYPLYTSGLPLGPLAATLEYWVEGEPVWISSPRQLTVGRVEAAIASAQPQADAGVLELQVEVAADGPSDELDLQLDAVVKALEWDRESLSFAEVVRSSHRYHLVAGGLGDDGVASVRIPVEHEPALWRVELSLHTEPQVSTQLNNNRILFGARTQETMISSGPPAPIAASPMAPTNNWESELATIEQRYSAFNFDQGAILFIGSSSIRGWRTLQTDFPGLPVLNAGFGGSQIIDAVYFFDRLVRPVAPHTIVMYSGSNDISVGKSPEQVFADYLAFVDAVHQAFPDTRIIYIGIAPSPARWSQRFNVQRANKLIEMYTQADDRLDYIDVYTHMLGDDGEPRPELYVADRLRMTPVGYALWTELVRPYLGL